MLASLINKSGGKRKVILLLVAVSVFIFFLFSYHSAQRKYEEYKQKSELLSHTVSALKDSVRTYKVRIGNYKVNVAEAPTLYVDRKNLAGQLKDQKKDLSALGIRMKYLESATRVATATTDTIQMPVYQDSLQFLHAEYRDSFTVINATIYRDNRAQIDYQANEVYDLYNYRAYRHRFLFFHWGRSDRYVLVPHNPKTSTTIRSLKIIKSE